ncbi:uncharacterized protein LOC142577992 [Dermacentor variabilis]|uniref:uncharacterized protein LOC142577992 n=1 Tax=Dermacentor variabilis TaxID=34621 RepID=UPI003F5C0C64
MWRLDLAPLLLVLLVLLRCCVSCLSETGLYNGPSRSHRNVSCFQCSWLSEQSVDDERRKEFAKRWKAAYADSEKSIHNPFKSPLLGAETFAQMPTKAQLAARCNNCSKIGGACARWTFYGNTGKPANVTWMCVNSRQTGCFLEHVAMHFTKEVCLCADRHHCNVATAAKPVSLLVGLLCATWAVASCTVLS